jgi:uncharacterized protein (DUF983 family)
VSAWRLFQQCVVRSRCPCCQRGPLFDGWLRIREGCPRCGLLFEQWAGEWITPTYLASTLGMLVAFALIGLMFATGYGMHGPVPPELSVSLVSGGVAIACLRPSKAFWLGFLWWIGGVEVSAETRAHLRWWALEYGDRWSELSAQAERRARSPRAPEPEPAPVRRRFGSLRGLLFPDARAPRRPGHGSRLEVQRHQQVERQPQHEEPAG